jgi:hypothetical protein
MKMTQQPDQDDHANTQGNCDKCGEIILRFRGQGDLYCDCGAIYNCGGQRLRDDLNTRPNPSAYDDDIGDMEGYEIAMTRGEE